MTLAKYNLGIPGSGSNAEVVRLVGGRSFVIELAPGERRAIVSTVESGAPADVVTVTSSWCWGSR